jgi:hypothetical protein
VRIGLAKNLVDIFYVPGLFDEGLVIPLAVRLRQIENIAAVDVDGASQFTDRIGHGMENFRSHGAHLSRSQGFGDCLPH